MTHWHRMIELWLSYKITDDISRTVWARPQYFAYKHIIAVEIQDRTERHNQTTNEERYITSHVLLQLCSEIKQVPLDQHIRWSRLSRLWMHGVLRKRVLFLCMARYDYIMNEQSTYNVYTYKSISQKGHTQCKFLQS